MPQINRLSIGPQLRITAVLVFHLLLMHCSTGQSKLIGSSQPIVATVGDDIILPCHLEPAVDVTAMTLEWTRSDLDPRFVSVWRSNDDLVNLKHPSYKGRTTLFTDELKQGNISLKLSKVKPADEGRYRCYVPDNNEDSLVELVVGAVASAVISLTGIDVDKGGVVLQCETKGWYPEPELLWLDAEGKILSAGPTETVRGPDDLYTVSSRVTVEKRHSNDITCRVQQRTINQTRETQIHVPDDLFNIQSSFFAATVGLAVSLVVCILFILLLVFFLWKIKNIRNRRCQRGESNEGKIKNLFKMKKTKDKIVTEDEQEKEQLMTNETQETEVVHKGKLKTKSKHEQQRREEMKKGLKNLKEELETKNKEEQQRREEMEKTVKNLKEELETKNKEVEKKQAELQQLQEENLHSMRNHLENKNKELKISRATKHGFFTSSSTIKAHQRKITEAEREVESLKKQLKTTETKIKEFKTKQAEIQKLQEEIKKMETNLQKLTNDTELEKSQAASAGPYSILDKLPTVSRQKLDEEKQRREEAEKEVQTLKQQFETQIQAEKQKRMKTETLLEIITKVNQLEVDFKMLKEALETKKPKLVNQILTEERVNKTLNDLLDKITELEKQLHTEKQNRKEEAQMFNTQLENTKKECQAEKQKTVDAETSTEQFENIAELETQQQTKDGDNKELKTLKQLLKKFREMCMQIQTEKQKRKQAENLNRELENKIKELKKQLQTEIQNLKETKHVEKITEFKSQLIYKGERMMKESEVLKNQLENINRELKTQMAEDPRMMNETRNLKKQLDEITELLNQLKPDDEVTRTAKTLKQLLESITEPMKSQNDSECKVAPPGSVTPPPQHQRLNNQQ
uniref:Ig-like domain-containing protein n=1 Tax=Anabas testudineus TaxID=64144 RepID=A0A3Q1IAP6_ANATE